MSEESQKIESKPVDCLQCSKSPEFINYMQAEDEVYWALECNCKQTPYMRSKVNVYEKWDSTTFGQTPARAYAVAKRKSPRCIPKQTYGVRVKIP